MITKQCCELFHMDGCDNIKRHSIQIVPLKKVASNLIDTIQAT